jgi:hypothetical protein
MGQGSCPYCGQGLLNRITIRRINMESFICDECETVWLKYEQISDHSGTIADNLLNWMGAPYDYQAEFEYHEIVEWPQP